jgi:ABC-type branched-subunit amino acid transport system substrate-binding protein
MITQRRADAGTKVTPSELSGVESLASEPAAPRFGPVAFTIVMITANHWFALGAKAFALGAGLLVLSGAMQWRLSKARTAPALAGYLLMSVWIVGGFGLYKGLWKGALNLFFGKLLSSLSTSFPKPSLGGPLFELSGLLMLIGSLFVLRQAYQLARSWLAERGYVALHVQPRERALLATAAGMFFVGVLAAFTWNAKDRWVAPQGGIVKIGVIVPTTGPYAVLGNSFVKAVEMARDDLKSTKYRYELVVRDSGQDPARARVVIDQLVNRDRVDALVGGISLIGQVTKGFARRARIPHLCVCTVGSIGDGAYNFTNIPSPEAEGIRWVQEAKRRGVRTIALLTQDYPSIVNHVNAMKIEARRAGLVIAYEHTFDGSVRDFRALIAAAQASHPEVNYVEALNPGLDLLGRQLAEAQVKNISSVVAPSLSEDPGAFEGAWYTDSNLHDIAFKARFEDKYPGTRFATHMMPYAYDSVNMIVQAFERGQNPAVYLRDLATYEGTADRLTKRPGSGNFQSTPAVWEIKGGKPHLLN